MSFNVGPRIITGNNIKLQHFCVNFFSGIKTIGELVCHTITSKHVATNAVILFYLIKSSPCIIAI